MKWKLSYSPLQFGKKKKTEKINAAVFDQMRMWQRNKLFTCNLLGLMSKQRPQKVNSIYFVWEFFLLLEVYNMEIFQTTARMIF